MLQFSKKCHLFGGALPRSSWSLSQRAFSTKYDKLLGELASQVAFDSDNRIVNLPEVTPLDSALDHAPKRQHTLKGEDFELAIKNHLKYFHSSLHSKLRPIFENELHTYGHIYMFNYMPKVPLEAVPFNLIPGKSTEARAMIHMILNNLDPLVAQFP